MCKTESEKQADEVKDLYTFLPTTINVSKFTWKNKPSNYKLVINHCEKISPKKSEENQWWDILGVWGEKLHSTDLINKPYSEMVLFWRGKLEGFLE